jgi:hypothetical protein
MELMAGRLQLKQQKTNIQRDNHINMEKCMNRMKKQQAGMK